ncbi:hypothetical protein KAJ38_00245 [Candidatus Pacearchaeota archaeon]|nr:hypothetical protein [Candidatus Pacearchaeota archaeon]
MKRGELLLIIGVLLIILVSGTGIYFYNFHVFKTVRLCIGDAKDMEISCGVTLDCVDLIRKKIDSKFSDAPDFILENFQKIIDEAVYCDRTCFVRNIRGVNLDTGAFEILDSCRVEEKEIVIEIRGKEGLEILKYLESKNEESFRR